MLVSCRLTNLRRGVLPVIDRQVEVADVPDRIDPVQFEFAETSRNRGDGSGDLSLVMIVERRAGFGCGQRRQSRLDTAGRQILNSAVIGVQPGVLPSGRD